MLNQIFNEDCLEGMKRIPTESVGAIIADPPYGVSYQSSWRTDKTLRKPKIENDDSPFVWWLYDAFRVAKEGGGLICFCEWRHAEVFRMLIGIAGFKVQSQIVWDRDWHGMGNLNQSFAPQHDLAWFATKGAFAFENGRPRSVIRAQREPADSIHPTMKPLDLISYLTRKISIKGETILDPFMGSATTAIACLEEGRQYIGFEKDETYFKLGQERIAQWHHDKAGKLF